MSSAWQPCCANTRSPIASAAAPCMPAARPFLKKPATLPATCARPSSCAPQISSGVSFAPIPTSSSSAHNDLSDDADIAARPEPKRSKTAAFVSDFRDLTVGDYVVHVEHGIAQYHGPERDRAGRPRRSNS